MAEPRRHGHPKAQILETGNALFFYRPLRGVLHPRSSDEIEHVYVALLPDDQHQHRNRLLTFAQTWYPPILPGLVLPEERGWAVVTDVTRDPRRLIDAVVRGEGSADGSTAPTTTPAARAAGDGRYLIARHDDHTDLAYALHQPRQLGPAQQTLLLDPQASYRVVVKEPCVPSWIGVVDKPTYPSALGEKFDGHVSIPLDPSSFLDYRWTQVFLFDGKSDVQTELGIALKRGLENRAEKQAFAALCVEAQRVRAGSAVDLLKPLVDGSLE
ncbi:MAG TPA: hypothetical protein VNL16_04460 [Chloroflexota bacterium]|nr:hypothetical protein [Chloroflexota bacterium]